MEVEIAQPDPADESQYYEQIDRMVKNNVSDFVVWDSYAAPDSEYGVDLSFFDNYRWDHNNLLIARHDETLCGFMAYDLDSSREDIPVDPPFTYISLLLVDAPCRGQGIATRLYSYLLNTLLPEQDGAFPVVLGTWEDNEQQRYLMEKFGFEVCARRPYHRENGEDTLYYSYSPD